MPFKDWKWWSCAALLITVAVIFARTAGYDFVHYDDPQILLANKVVHDFDVKGMFTEFQAVDYIPMTLLSFAIDENLAGLKPWIFHTVNVIFHFLDSLLVLALAWRLTKNQWASLFTALLFAVHPLHVESVAWVTERKDVLCTFFVLLAALVYVRYRERGRLTELAACFALFVLAILSKTVAVTFPAILLAFDYFLPGAATDGKKPWGRYFAEKVPFFAVAAAIAYLRLTVHDESYIIGRHVPTIADKFGYFFEAIAFYVSKTVLPFRLSIIYEENAVRVETWQFELTALVLGALAYVSWKKPQSRRGIVFGLLFAFFALLPVLRFFPFGNRLIFADRYMYIPSIGLFLAAAYALTWTRAAIAAAAAVTLIMAVTALERVPVWQNDVTLWTDAKTKYPESSIATHNLGLTLMIAGDRDRGIDLIHQAIVLDPTHISAFVNLSEVYSRMENYDAAEDLCRQALKVAPDHPEVHIKLAQILAKKGLREQAEAELAKAREVQARENSKHD